MVIAEDLTVDDLINIHSDIQRRFNTVAVGIKNRGLLDSIVQRPNLNPYSHVPFRSIYAKCASLVEGIIKWHPFIDGNKRTGLAAAYAYMHKNNYNIMLPFNAVRFSVLIAQDKKDIHQISNWIRSISAKDDKIFDKKFEKQVVKPSRKLIDIYHSGSKDKAKRILDKWLACDIYPEYKSEISQTLDFLSDLVHRYSKESNNKSL